MIDARNWTLKERALFKEAAGIAVEQVDIGPRPCRTHRLMVRHCKDCPKARTGLCPKHLEEYELCDDCPPPSMPDEVLAAIVLVEERRINPELTLDEIRDRTLADLMERFDGLVQGNADGSQGSSRNMSNGSRPSSTSTRGSRPKATHS